MAESVSEWFDELWQEIAGHDRAERREILMLSYVYGTDQGEPSIGWLGRSWIRRDAGYWCRRISITIVYLLLALTIGPSFLGLAPFLLLSHQYPAIAHLPLTLRIILVVVWSSTAIPAYLAMYRRLELYGFERSEDRPMFSARFLGARYVVLLAIPLFPAIGGMALAMFTVTLRLNFPGERAAREAQRQHQELMKENAAQRRPKNKKRRRSSKH